MRLIEDLVNLLRRRAQGSGGQVELSKLRPEDLADAMQRLSPEEGAALLREMEPEMAGQVMVELPTETARRLVSLLPDETLIVYLDTLPMDDAIDLQEELEPERFEALLERIPSQDAQEIRRLQAYPRGTVGRLMTEAFFEVGPDRTMSEVLADLRSASEDKYETVNDVYVLDDNRHLLGVFSLRKALRASPWDRARSIMRDDVVVCNALDEDEDAARKMARYGFYALPVLDERGRMLGLFTGDDAQQILRETETEQVLALGAVSGSAESYLSLNVIQLYMRRIPWLTALFFAEMLTGAVLRHYGQSESGLSIAPLMFFVPLLIGAGGNTGSQVTTTITRALALGEVRPSDWLTVICREFLTAILIGATLGLFGFLRAYLPGPFGWSSGYSLSLIVGMALPAIVIWAAAVGSLLPIAAKRIGLDPAVMSAPFITTFVDATGLIIYFEIAKAVLRP